MTNQSSLLPVFICGRTKPLSKSEFKDLSKKLSEANKKWTALRKKYSGKTVREILQLEKSNA